MRLAAAALALLATAAGLPAQPHPCRFTADPVSIDGVLSEPCWDLAEPLAFTLPVSQGTPGTLASAWMAWTSDELVVAFSASDEELAATRTLHDSDTFRDDAFEVFVMPRDRSGIYHAFEMNLLGTMRDGISGRWSARWNCPGARVATRTAGTVNSPEDHDTGWCLEVAIPFAELDALGGARPSAGETWRFNLARRDVDRDLPGGYELSCTAPVSVVNFHQWPEWTAVRFEGP